jgi:hypothetical protein
VNSAIWLSVNDMDSSKAMDSIFFMVYRPRRIAAGDLSRHAGQQPVQPRVDLVVHVVHQAQFQGLPRIQALRR